MKKIEKEQAVVKALSELRNGPSELEEFPNIVKSELAVEKFVALKNGTYYITHLGSWYLEQSEERPELNLSDSAFKWEARTGCVRSGASEGKQSHSDRCCVSTAPRHKKPNSVEAKEVAMIDKIDALCKKYMIDKTELGAMLESGELKVCNHGGTPHLGLFSPGHYICRECRRRGK